MQEKKNTPKIIVYVCVCVCERERERGREKQPFCDDYTKNGRENNKFIEDGVNMKRQSKGKWMDRWIVTLRLRGRLKSKGMRKVGESAIIKKK